MEAISHMLNQGQRKKIVTVRNITYQTFDKVYKICTRQFSFSMQAGDRQKLAVGELIAPKLLELLVHQLVEL